MDDFPSFISRIVICPCYRGEIDALKGYIWRSCVILLILLQINHDPISFCQKHRPFYSFSRAAVGKNGPLPIEAWIVGYVAFIQKSFSCRLVPFVFIIIFITRIFFIFTLANNTSLKILPLKTQSQVTQVIRILACLFYILLIFMFTLQKLRYTPPPKWVYDHPVT